MLDMVHVFRPWAQSSVQPTCRRVGIKDRMVSYVEVKEALRSQILDGSLGTGSKLPPERALAAEFGASRNTVRKATKALAADAYITNPRNARPVVIYESERRSASSDGDPHRGLDSDGKLAQDILDSSPLEVLEARLAIEPEAVALATLRARSDNICEIREALAASLAATDIVKFEYWDARLHQAIFRATRNTALIAYYQALNHIRNQPSWIALKKKSLTRERQRLYDRQHTAIVSAVVSRLPDRAKSAMRAHLESVRKAMML
jgi:DNA-binding FadR family transcriptional regulator